MFGRSGCDDPLFVGRRWSVRGSSLGGVYSAIQARQVFIVYRSHTRNKVSPPNH